MSTPLVLASASPARLSTLRSAGIEPRVVISEVDEDAVVAALDHRPQPAEHALLLARAKGEEVAGRLAGGVGLVLGCDSVLEIDGEVQGKPHLPRVAVERWRRMRGRSGVLHTGHHLTHLATGRTAERSVATVVHFADLRDAEIEAYVATGEPLQVAGGFTIDGRGGPFVRGIEGDHHNVVGLSLATLRELAADLGVGWFDLTSA